MRTRAAAEQDANQTNLAKSGTTEKVDTVENNPIEAEADEASIPNQSDAVQADPQTVPLGQRDLAGHVCDAFFGQL